MDAVFIFMEDRLVETPPTKKPIGCIPIGCGSLLVLVVIIGGCSALFNHTGDGNPVATATAASMSETNTAENAPTAEPTDPPTPSPGERKRDFIASVDESISGKRIAGNPFKFVGDHVDLHGKVDSIVDEQHFNLSTGSIEVGDDGSVSDTSGEIVVECASTTDLEAGQSIRVLGTVATPIEGTNAMGGSRQFPTVHAEFME